MMTTAQKMREYTGLALFERGFRPFFLGAGLFAGLIMPIWVLVLIFDYPVPSNFLPRDWHLHEMVFGFIPAVLAGFLLTAIPNWTGRLPVLGMPLAALWCLWIAGRIAVSFSQFSPLGAAIVDCAFLVVFASLVWREILSGRNYRNAPIGLLVIGFAIANIAFHYLHITEGSTYWVERLALGVVAILLVLVGGRITPSFTLNWMRQHGLTPLPAAFGPFDKIALSAAGSAVIAWILYSEHVVSGWLFVLAALLSCVRIARWRGISVITEPLLFVLHLGQFWIPVWFSLMALSILVPDAIDETTALHALSVGAVGTMTLAVMTRASLGHAGRPLKAGKGAITIFALVILAALVRICANWLPFDYMQILMVSGLLWSASFMLFFVLWAPMLTTRGKV
jgi:uncharacterized protein involved in response to NO